MMDEYITARLLLTTILSQSLGHFPKTCFFLINKNKSNITADNILVMCSFSEKV